MTQQITILLATLEQLVGALDDADDYLADCDIPEDRKVRANINMALTAGRAALEGAERVEEVRPDYFMHEDDDDTWRECPASANKTGTRRIRATAKESE